MKNEMTISRAAFVAGAGAAACALAGCSGGLGGAGGAKTASTADAACVDDNANVTVYAAINLGGADLVRLLKHQNYEWQGESVGYGAVDDAGFFAFTFSEVSDDVDELANSAIPLSESEYEELEPGGGDDSVAILLSVAGYTTGDRALAGAIGDAAITSALDVIERVGARGSLEHVQLVAPADVRPEDGRLVAPGGRSVTLAQAAAAAGSGLAASVRFQLPGPVFPFGAYAVVVEIDRDTGRLEVRRLVGVDDGGRIVNPLLAEGQIVGSAVQGIGQALFEEAVYDDAGQLMTGNFAVYGLPSAVEAPTVEGELQETPSPFTPLGFKGLGESGAIAVPTAVANAVADALAPLGVTHVDPPYTPEKLWRVLRSRSAAGLAPPGGRSKNPNR